MQNKVLFFFAFSFSVLNVSLANRKLPAIYPAIVQESTQEVKVFDNGKFVKKVKRSVLVLQSEGAELAVLKVAYTSNIKVKSISGEVFDLNGKSIKKAKKSDVQDYSNFNSFSVYEDNRLKVLDLKQGRYPYRVDFEYEVEFPNLYYIPDWYPQPYFQIPVMKAVSTYDYPLTTGLRFFSTGILEQSLSERVENNRIIKTWELKEIEGLGYEPLLPEPNNGVKTLFVSPSKFSYDGFDGQLDSWESMGAWFFSLNKGKDQLNESTKSEIELLTRSLKTDYEKIKALYQYMQNKTRYVSIQLGLGGLKPFDALTVDNYGYGDCKALTNYMGALLSHVGIRSHYALVHAGENRRKVNPDFPADYFNHVILSVPLEKDTIWLECTSQTNLFGYLSDFTSDRHSLLVTENGGVLVKTPKYGQVVNSQIQKGDFRIENSGQAIGKVALKTSGLQVENGGLLKMVRSAENEKLNWIHQYFASQSVTINDYSFEIFESEIPEVNFESIVVIKNLAIKTGHRLFLQPNFLNVNSIAGLKNTNERKNDFELKLGYQDEDSFTYELPAAFIVESLPKSLELETEFGYYKYDLRQFDDKIIFSRVMKVNDGIYPASKFSDYLQFIDQIQKTDKQKAVFKSVDQHQ